MNKERIAELVENIVQLYMREDYNYTVSMVKEGRRLDSLKSVITMEDEIAFIKSVKEFIPVGTTEDEINVAAAEIRSKILAIDLAIEDQYGTKNKRTLREDLTRIIGIVTNEEFDLFKAQMKDIATRDLTKQELDEAAEELDDADATLLEFTAYNTRVCTEVTLIKNAYDKLDRSHDDNDGLVDFALDTLTNLVNTMALYRGDKASIVKSFNDILEILA